MSNIYYCGFDIQTYGGDTKVWVVPITHELPFEELDIEVLTARVNEYTDFCNVFNCYMVVGSKMNVLFDDGTVSDADLDCVLGMLKF
jgi:hypothetical protein